MTGTKYVHFNLSSDSFNRFIKMIPSTDWLDKRWWILSQSIVFLIRATWYESEFWVLKVYCQQDIIIKAGSIRTSQNPGVKQNRMQISAWVIMTAEREKPIFFFFGNRFPEMSKNSHVCVMLGGLAEVLAMPHLQYEISLSLTDTQRLFL